MRSRSLLLAAVAATVASLAVPVRAGSIEDSFRGYIEKLRSKGQQLLGRGEASFVTKPTLVKRTDKLPLGQSEIAVFVTPGCRSCDDAVEYVRRLHWNLEVLDLSKSETARDAFALTKARGVPTVLVGKQMLVGWNEKLFKRAVSDTGPAQAPLEGGGS